MPRREPCPSALVRAIARRAWLPALASLALAAMLAGSAPGASSSVVVSMNVPSATSMTNQCTQSPAWNFGVVQPGTAATTATDANVCRIRFSSTNDTSALRVYQADRENTAMARAQLQWDQRVVDPEAFYSVDAAPGGRVIVVGARGNTRTSSDSGASFPTGGVNSGGVWDNLNDVEIVDATPSIAWVAGHVGTIMRTTDGGASWTELVSGSTEHFWSVLAVDGATAYVGGGSGTILRTTNTGASWLPVTSNTTSDINDFARRAANDMWLAASNNVVRRSTDGGNTWVAPATNPSWSHWNAIDVTGTSTVWVAGSSAGKAAIARSTNHGATWQDVGTWDGQDIEDIHAVSDTEAWVVGRDGTIMRTTDGGTSWVRFAFPSTSSLYGITQATDGRIVIATMNEEVHHTTDGSSFPTSFDGGSAASLSGVDAVPLDRRVLVTVGDAGVVRRSTDRGTTWNTVATPSSEHLRAVSLVTSGFGWAVGHAGTILRTTDAGLTWTSQASGTTQDLYGVHAVTERIGWAVGRNGRVLRTTNAGATWTWLTSGTTQHLWAISAVDDQVAWIGGTSGRIRVTGDGGSTWASRDSPQSATVYQLHARSASRAFGVTDWPGTISTFDGGLTWTEGWSRGGRKAAAFLGGRFVAASDTWANAVHSSDDGLSVQDFSNPGHYIHGRGMAAIDANRVVMVGENGTVSVSRVRDPIPDYGGAGSTWASPASGLFGACLQDAGAGTTALWPEDTGNVAGRCEALSGDAWTAVPQAPTSIATTTLGTDAYVDLVWGVRAAANQSSGTYLATISFETIAPAA